MKISILTTDNGHPVFPHLYAWQSRVSAKHEVELVTNEELLAGGDILFLISCNKIIDKKIRSRYQVSLVIHASDLPKGRGWSPHVWQIIEGNNNIIISLLEADESVDNGPIWCKREMILEGHELWDEINEKLFSIELEMMDFAVENFFRVNIRPQKIIGASYYPKRTPEDSRIDPHKTIAEQFNLLRIADPDRFPAFFDLNGHRYEVNLVKIKKGES